MSPPRKDASKELFRKNSAKGEGGASPTFSSAENKQPQPSVSGKNGRLSPRACGSGRRTEIE